MELMTNETPIRLIDVHSLVLYEILRPVGELISHFRKHEITIPRRKNKNKYLK